MLLGQLVEAETRGVRPGEIVVAREPQLLGCADEGFANRQRAFGLRHAKRPALAMPFIVERVVVLGFPEIGQHFPVAPAGAASLRPVVIVKGVSARINLALMEEPRETLPGIPSTLSCRCFCET